jgi:hypothetical protein
VVDVVGVGAGVYDRLVELSIPVTPDNGRTVDSRGHIKIESKDDMRKRGLPSPDRGDTLAMVMSRSTVSRRSTSMLTSTAAALRDLGWVRV